MDPLASGLPLPSNKVIPSVFHSSPIVNYTNIRPNPGKWVLMGLLALLIGWVNLTKNYTKPSLNSLKSISTETAANKISAIDEGNRWTYTNIVHPKHGRLHWAEIASTNALSFAFPYNSGSIGYFTIGQKRGHTRMMLRVEKGLYVPKVIEGDSVRIQLDNAPAEMVSIGHAYVYGRHVFYIQPGIKFLSAIQKATRMRVAVQFYGEPVKQLEFYVKGLKWPL